MMTNRMANHALEKMNFCLSRHMLFFAVPGLGNASAAPRQRVPPAQKSNSQRGVRPMKISTLILTVLFVSISYPDPYPYNGEFEKTFFGVNNNHGIWLYENNNNNYLYEYQNYISFDLNINLGFIKYIDIYNRYDLDFSHLYLGMVMGHITNEKNSEEDFFGVRLGIRINKGHDVYFSVFDFPYFGLHIGYSVRIIKYKTIDILIDLNVKVNSSSFLDPTSIKYNYIGEITSGIIIRI